MYSYQPDEMLTFMSLASMKPGQGIWIPNFISMGVFIYPAGAG